MRQAPALVDDGHELIYAAVNPDPSREGRFRFANLSTKEGKWARRTGALNLFGKIKKLRPDAIQLCSIEQLPLGLALKLFTKFIVVYDCREDMYNAMREHKPQIPRLLRPVLARGVKIIEWMAAKYFDGIVASDKAIYDSHRAAPPKRKCIFYNTPPLSMFKPDYLPLADRPHDLVVLGSITPRSGILDVLEAVGQLKSQGRSINVMLLGQPSDDLIDQLNECVSKYGMMGQVVITGRIPHEEVPKVLPTCKIGVVALPDMPKFRNNIACKTFEYMACGMPVICSDLPPQRTFVEEGKNGCFFSPGDVKQLAELISNFLDDPDKAKEFGARGRAMAEESWNCEREQEKLRRFYRSLLTNSQA
jgi:glycosyltransferase involved in cell wall biosynthesis